MSAKQRGVYYVLILLSLCGWLTAAVDYPPSSSRSRERDRQYQHHRTSTTPSPSEKRSYKCLIIEVGEYNHLPMAQVKFTLMGEHGEGLNKTFRYHLKFGTESYEGTGTSKKKSQDAVSKTAYEHTHYRKRPLSPKMCTISHSPVNTLHEWAQKRQVHIVFYTKQQIRGPPKKYVIQCEVMMAGNFSAEATSTSKKMAKAMCAEAMLAKLEDMHIPVIVKKNRMVKYNNTEVSEKMHPVSRLYEIQAAGGQQEPIFRSESVDRMELDGKK